MPSINIADSSGKGNIVTANGDVTISNASFKFNGGSYYFDGTGDNLVIPHQSALDFGSGDFTIHFWINQSSSTNGALILDKNYSPSATDGFYMATFTDASKYYYFEIRIGGSGYSVNSGEDFTSGWHHVAVVRDGTTLRLFVNGIEKDTTSIGSGAYNNNTDNLIIGSRDDPSNYLTGYMDEIHITKGKALWTTNFLPLEEAANGLDDNTKLLIHGDDDIDVSHSTRTVTNNNVALSSTKTKFQSTSLSFNGSSSYLSLSDSNDFYFGSGDFTIELWINTTRSAGEDVIEQYESGNNSNSSFLVNVDSANHAESDFYVGGTAYSMHGGSSAIADGNWHHLAFVRYGTTIKTYLDGIEEDSVSIGTAALNNSTQSLIIGTGTRDDYLGYMDEIKISKGVARWTTDFVPEIRPYPLIVQPQVVDAETKLLLHMTGANNDTATDDYSESDHAIAFNGNAKISTAQKKFDTGSLLLDGTGDYLNAADSSDWDWANDYTVDCWVRFNNVSPFQVIFSHEDISTNYFRLGWNGSVNKWIVSDGNTNTIGGGFSDSLAINTWYHVAVVRQDTTVSLYRDGILKGSGSDSTSVSAGSNGVVIGANYDHNDGFVGYIDEFRITKGKARQISNFDPAIEAHPEAQDQSTKLLMHMEQEDNAGLIYFKDSSNVNQDIFPNGDVTLSSTQKKFGARSAYFDGTGDYLSLLNSTDFDFSTNDYTIDFWFHTPTPVSVEQLLVLDKSSSHTAGNYAISIYIGASSIRSDISDGSSEYILEDTSPVFGGWNHFALIRKGNTTYLYINGVQEDTVAMTNAMNWDTSHILIIGARYDGFFPYAGYIDEVRITKGIARWTAAFTPPAAPYPDYM